MADPGFPRGGALTPKGGAPTYYLVNFSRKLHKNEEILGQGGARPSRPPLDPPLICGKWLNCEPERTSRVEDTGIFPKGVPNYNQMSTARERSGR